MLKQGQTVHTRATYNQPDKQTNIKTVTQIHKLRDKETHKKETGTQDFL